MPADLLTYSISSGPEAAYEARTLVTEALQTRVGSDRLEEVRLLVSELVTNGVVHGGGVDGGKDLTLNIAANGVLRVDVVDHGGGFTPGPPQPEPIGGWGLMLVEGLADRWGVTREGGTRVWFEIAV